MTNLLQIGPSPHIKESQLNGQSDNENPHPPIQTPPSKAVKKPFLERYVMRETDRGPNMYRYFPPMDAVRAGVVKRKSFKKKLAEANRYAAEQNVFLDAWRKEQKHLKRLTEKACVRDLIKSYERNISFKKLSKNTAESYLYYLSVWAEDRVGNMVVMKARLSDINTPMCQRLYDKYASTSISTANHCLKVWRLLFNYAIRQGFTLHNPFTRVKPQTVRHRKVVWQQQHLKKFLDVAYSSFKTRNVGLIVQMAYEWGQRLGDMRLLRWDNYNFETRVLSLEQNKRRARVELPTSAGLHEMLMQQHETYGWQPFIAPTNKPDRKGGLVPYCPTLLARHADMLKKEAGIPHEIKLFDLRRTAVTEMIEAEVPLTNIMAMTGHSTPASVAPYIKHTLKGAMVAARARGFI